MKQGNEDKL